MSRTKVPEFKDFWKAYPLHRCKVDAEKAWDRLSARDKQKALAGVPRYREECQRTGMNIKCPQGWLNGRRWEDEYEDSSMLGQMNVRGKADGLTTSAIIVQEPTTDGPADTLADMETW